MMWINRLEYYLINTYLLESKAVTEFYQTKKFPIKLFFKFKK